MTQYKGYTKDCHSNTELKMIAPVPTKNRSLAGYQHIQHLQQHVPRLSSPLTSNYVNDISRAISVDNLDRNTNIFGVTPSPTLSPSLLDNNLSSSTSNSESGTTYRDDSEIEMELDEIEDEIERDVTPIPLFLHGDHVLIFNSESMKELTIKHGITGQLSGTLPLAPQQNSLLGFPWRLSLYETLWCIFSGVGVLIDSEDIIKDGYLKEFAEDESKRNIVLHELHDRLDRWRDDKQKEIDEQMKKLNIKKRDRKVMKPLDNVLVSSASMPDLQQVLSDKQKEEKEIEDAKLERKDMQEKSRRNNIVFMETPSDDSRISYLWTGSLERYYQDKNSLGGQKALLFDLISNSVGNEEDLEVEKVWMNFQMYSYLKDKLGHHLLPGMRFGGTFVSYPGDPLRYHAQQIVESREYYNEDIGLFKISNRGRLATGVRKVWVVGGSKTNVAPKEIEEMIESLGDDSTRPTSQSMTCFSIEWAGF